jgi:hypothetical protein
MKLIDALLNFAHTPKKPFPDVLHTEYMVRGGEKQKQHVRKQEVTRPNKKKLLTGTRHGQNLEQSDCW